jgi:hypothetical protein
MTDSYEGLRLTLAFPPEHEAALMADARWLEVSPERGRELAGRGWRVVEVAAVSEHEAALGGLERACEALRLISYGEVPGVEFADDDLVAAYAQEVLASLDAGEPGEPSLAAQARIATEEMCGEPDPDDKTAGRGAAAAVPSEGSGDGGVGAGTDAPRPADDEPWAAWERITSVPFAADRAAELAGDIGAVVVTLDRLRGRAAVLACDLRTIERSTDE